MIEYWYDLELSKFFSSHHNWKIHQPRRLHWYSLCYAMWLYLLTFKDDLSQHSTCLKGRYVISHLQVHYQRLWKCGQKTVPKMRLQDRVEENTNTLGLWDSAKEMCKLKKELFYLPMICVHKSMLLLKHKQFQYSPQQGKLKKGFSWSAVERSLGVPYAKEDVFSEFYEGTSSCESCTREITHRK